MIKGELMDGMDLVLISVNLVSVIILLFLLYVYVKNYRNIKSRFNLGLILFSALFLVENLLILHLALFQWPHIANSVIVAHMVAIDIIELLGLASLFYITWK